MRQRTKPLTEPAAPPGWSVRRTSLADRFAGVTASLLLGSTAIAGSLAAGGYLAQGKSLAHCGKLGSLAAAEVISHYGPRPATPLSALATQSGL
jgi:hypothetical protein